MQLDNNNSTYAKKQTIYKYFGNYENRKIEKVIIFAYDSPMFLK